MKGLVAAILLIASILLLLPAGGLSSDSEDDISRIRSLDRSLAQKSKLLQVGPSRKNTSSLLAQLDNSNIKIFARIFVRNFLSVPLTGGTGRCHLEQYGLIHATTPVPREVYPGSEESFVTMQAGNSRGTSGTAEWSLKTSTAAGERLIVRVVWSVPYGFVVHKSYVGVEVARKQRPLDDSFYDIYNDAKKSLRAGGPKATHNLDDIVVYGQMTPDNDKRPTVVLTVASLDPQMMHDFDRPNNSKKNLSGDDNSDNGFALVSVFWIVILAVSSVIICVLLVRLACCLMPCKRNRGANNNNNIASVVPVANGEATVMSDHDEEERGEPVETDRLTKDVNDNVERRDEV